MKTLTAKWVAPSLGIFMLIACVAQAQNATEATVTVNSNPPGVTVVLTGDLTVAGVTPTIFTQRLAGFYKVDAYRDGYENYRSSLVISGQEATNITINLKPKTRIKAAMRSLIIPGWGQRYAGSKVKGSLLFFGAVAGVATAGVMHLKYEHDRDDYFDFLDRFTAEKSVEVRETMLDELYSLQKDAYNSERRRNVTGAVVAGFWVYSVLDAILFFPDYGISVSGTSLSLAPEYDGNEVKLMGRVTF